MEKVRIGNDIQVKYTVLRDGQPESFVGATNIVVEVRNEAYGKIIPSTFNIVGNIVNIILDAKDCVLCGKHRVTLSYNRGNDITIDALAFELVQYTSLTGGTEIVGVEIVTVNISGDIGIAIPDNNKIDLDGLNSNVKRLQFDTVNPVAGSQVGQVFWSNEEKTLVLNDGYHTHPIGKELGPLVKNNSGQTIINGQACYVIGSTGDNPTIGLASVTNGDVAQKTIGLATMDIPNNGFGIVTTFGEVNDVNTSTLTQGAIIYLGVNGALTTTEPVATTAKIIVGICVRQHATVGKIFVATKPIPRLSKLSDVYTSTLNEGDVLRWNGTTLRYEAYSLTNKADLVGGKIPTSQLPAYVDDVLEYANLAAFPSTGETGKIYVALDTNLTYRWSGTAYVEISKSLALGETSSTAYRGDRGKTAYDHSQASGNPHGTTASQIPNTPAGTVAATTVQGAINELASDIVQVETDLNKNIIQLEIEDIKNKYSKNAESQSFLIAPYQSQNVINLSDIIKIGAVFGLYFDCTGGNAIKIYASGTQISDSIVINDLMLFTSPKDVTSFALANLNPTTFTGKVYLVYGETVIEKVNKLRSDVGYLNELKTDAKGSITQAINELYDSNTQYSVYKNAYDYGFNTENSGDANSIALQSCINGGGTIIIDHIGVYNLSKTITIPSRTKLVFGENVYIKRVLGADGTIPTYTFVNDGALSGVTNENIQIYGLKLMANGLDAGNKDITGIFGLRGLLSFYHIKHLIVDGYQMVDGADDGKLLRYMYGIQVADFEDVTISNTIIESYKDGIHFSYGRDFHIHDCYLRTHDDPIALNAMDYPGSNPGLGNISNGIIERVVDMYWGNTDRTDSKRFTLLLIGSWGNWENGKTYRLYGDTVVSNGRIYRSVTGSPSINTAIASSQPTHTQGSVTGSDGINWMFVQNGNLLSANISNITFRDIIIRQPRIATYYLSMEDSAYVRSYYPNSVTPLISNLTIDNHKDDSTLVGYTLDRMSVIYGNGNVDTMRINKSVIRGNLAIMQYNNVEGIIYNKTNYMLVGNEYKQDIAPYGGKIIYLNNPILSGLLKTYASVVDAGYVPSFSGTITKVSGQCDI